MIGSRTEPKQTTWPDRPTEGGTARLATHREQGEGHGCRNATDERARDCAREWWPSAVGCVSSISTGTVDWIGPAGPRDSGQRSKKIERQRRGTTCRSGWESIAPPSTQASGGRPFKASPLHSQQVVRSLQGRSQIVFSGQFEVFPVTMGYIGHV